MNDLMPPPRRPMPPEQRMALRRLLQQPTQELSSRRRSASPWLAAAAVVAIAAGGYGVASLGGDAAPDMAPVGGGSSTAPPGPSPTPTSEASTTPDSLSTIPTLSTDAAYDSCIAQVRQQAKVTGDPVGDPRGRAIASTADAITVVVSDGTSAWACNVTPDKALSHPVPDSAPQDVDASTFAFALTFAGNVGAGDGQLAWAGGLLPKGATGLTYVFPDGHRRPAVVKGGYWVMQYLSEEDWAGNLTKTDPVQVEVGDGQTVIVPLGPETVCNQVTHGC